MTFGFRKFSKRRVDAFVGLVALSKLKEQYELVTEIGISHNSFLASLRRAQSDATRLLVI